VLHYDVTISFVPDFAFDARTRLDVLLREGAVRELRLDFDGPHVDRVTLHERPLGFRRDDQELVVDLGGTHGAGEIVPLVVEYHGRPDGRGLRAGPNAQGHPTLFADNWPENARRWIPSIDHPSDKATVDFTVTAEDRYEVVAPGRLVETRSLHDERRTTRWSEAVPIPTYCMVIGLAEFQVTHMGAADRSPSRSWPTSSPRPPGARPSTRAPSSTRRSTSGERTRRTASWPTSSPTSGGVTP
jgi:aminopeptidase N